MQFFAANCSWSANSAPAGVPQNTAKAAQALATVDKIATVTNPTDIKHSAVVTSAQQDAGAALLLHIQGTETHDHTVNLTAQEKWSRSFEQNSCGD